jgi:hypothetical protein
MNYYASRNPIHSAQIVKHSRKMAQERAWMWRSVAAVTVVEGHAAPVESASPLPSPIVACGECSTLPTLAFARGHLSSSPRAIRSSISAAFCQFDGIRHDQLKPGLGETVPAPGRAFLVASKTSCGISRRPRSLHFHPESRSLTKPYSIGILLV